MKKKIYTIGRGEGCDIVIPDNTDVISRLHATIRVESNDKIFLTDQSRNGTYVNGMKMSSNVEIPVSRKDVVSFAHIYNLDWSLVPKQKSYVKIVGVILFLAILVVGAVFFFFGVKSEKSVEPIELPPLPSMEKTDTVAPRDTVSDKSQAQETVKPKATNVPQKKDSVKLKEEKTKDEKPKEEEIYNPIY